VFLLHSQSDTPEQTLHRAQRDVAWEPLHPYWRPKRLGGRNLTLTRMPDNVKIDLVNSMALGPAHWSAQVTMAKTESKVSSWRHDESKKLEKRRRPRVRSAHTSTHLHNCMHMYTPTYHVILMAFTPNIPSLTLQHKHKQTHA